MTDTEKLEKKIELSGKKKKYLAEKVGLSEQGFRNCCVNRAEFKTSQVKILCDELDIVDLAEREAIFFSNNVALKATNKEA